MYWYLYRGLAELFVGDYDAAIKWCRYSAQQNEKFVMPYRVMAAAYVYKGMLDQAVQAFAEVERYDPGFTIEAYSERGAPQFKHADDLEYLLDGLRAAGAKES